ncbi:nucleotidyl transferase AbiEii/AbiGii toxin family protein [Marinilabilia sp.]|uniref:nucleotidyl transferase AbiEii/AbiGii toxin family protein n=1 Tax=Marinilabilia sp. TaxID=2021252 RepID=UPI0025C4283B|nr:nucleotidyl transferase AbiEii/AbiGii toxin family protein [Marinilabilia sp.]
MKNRTINIGVVAEVARILKDFKDHVVFVGGAVVSLYADDPAADEIRPTQDIDMTLNIINLSNWADIQDKLASLGIHPDPFGHAICSYRYKDIPIDIMPAEDSPLGPANRWYKIGFDNLRIEKVHDQVIQILPTPCYLATKFEAFNDRGKDYRTSHDMEDIIYVIDNNSKIVEEIQNTDKRIKNYLIEQLQTIEEKQLLEEVIMSHVHPIMLEERMPIVIEKINKILGIG